MTDQSPNTDRQENATSGVPLQPQGTGAGGENPSQDPSQPDFVGDDQHDEEDLRTDMGNGTGQERPEEAGEELAEDVNRDGADSISQSATGGLGNADPQLNQG